MYVGMGRELVAIGQLNARFPMAIVTREPIPDFTWSWLTGRTLLAPGAGGTAPYEFTAGVMREHGVDPAGCRFVRDLSTEMLRELYEQGLGDALIADPLTTESLRRAGTGYPALRLSEVAGPMPNSVYYAERARLDDLLERNVALMAGVKEAMDDLSAGADPSSVITAEWPDGEFAALKGTAAGLAADGTWSGIRIEPAALDRWVGILRAHGLMACDATYADLVDVRVADAVESADVSRRAAR
jgi:NitT/TauT family transport system substrate-binding protein